MKTVEYFKERFEKLEAKQSGSRLHDLRREAFHDFSDMGVPGARHEEWKYTRIGSLFNTPMNVAGIDLQPELIAADIDAVRLPAETRANEIVFLNGLYSSQLSSVISKEIEVLPLETAAADYSEIVSAHLGHSRKYLKDGILALNTSFLNGGVFIYVGKGKQVEHPVYIYNITDARQVHALSQPRSLIYVGENASAQFAENYRTLGSQESLTNQVIEIVVEKDARVEYYKIQNDADHANQVSTTHIRQIGKSYVHTVTISLSGNIVRNNLNSVLEAEHCEAHLYGLYFLQGKSHVDNHTIVDNVQPHCFSNELYKGIMDGNATGVFNGKIFVEPRAQKTNAYQSNKNILLSAGASVNTKPQLEIFADDVKCSHGCTVGRLNEEGLFYLRSRGISEKAAKALLLHAFADDILEHIRPEPLRKYVDKLISKRLDAGLHD